jgi:hypothetical protein
MEGYTREEFLAIFGLFLGHTIDLSALISSPELFASSILTSKISIRFSNILHVRFLLFGEKS